MYLSSYIILLVAIFGKNLNTKTLDQSSNFNKYLMLILVGIDREI